MNNEEFKKLVREMRAEQRMYFMLRRTGSPQPKTMETLERSKYLEKRVDEFLATPDTNTIQTTLL
jgi:hypothetical protein